MKPHEQEAPRYFVCWDANNEDMPGAEPRARNRALDALGVEGAAEWYASRIYEESDYPDEMTIMVRDPNGMVHTVAVTVEMVPTFLATVKP